MEKVKIIVFVPRKATSLVRDAISGVGAGKIGNYDFCTFVTKGTGSFRPNEKADPAIGKSGKLEFVKEDRIEFICDKKVVKKVIEAILNVHPYETPEIDIFPLLTIDDLN